jgi:threonine/homoserine/homoserine lactone efflux protein
MNDLQDILFAGLTGFISGLLLSIPVGPINLTIMNEGARRGFYWALMIGLGATTMEVIYCFIAFTDLLHFQQGVVKAVMELSSFVFMLYLGVKFLLAKTVTHPVDLGKTAEHLKSRSNRGSNLTPRL